MPKTVGYIILNGKEDIQIDRIQHYCAGNNIQNVTWIRNKTEEFIEVMIRSDFPSNIKTLIVAHNDLIAEDTETFFAYKAVLARRGITLIAAIENHHNSPHAESLDSMVRKLIQIENKIPQKKTYMIKPRYPGATIPLGYRRENGKMAVDEKNAEIIRLIFRCKYSGISAIGTARYVNNLGFRTGPGNLFRPASINYIWDNEPLYQGMRKDENRKWIKAEHADILNLDELKKNPISIVREDGPSMKALTRSINTLPDLDRRLNWPLSIRQQNILTDAINNLTKQKKHLILRYFQDRVPYRELCLEYQTSPNIIRKRVVECLETDICTKETFRRLIEE